MIDLTTQIDEIEGQLIRFAVSFLKANIEDEEVLEMFNEHLQLSMESGYAYDAEQVVETCTLVEQKLDKRTYPI